MARADGIENEPQAGVDLVAGPANVESIVAGHDAEVDRKEGHLFGDGLREAIDAVNMEVAQVKYFEAVEAGRQVFKGQAHAPDDRPKCVGAAAIVQPDHLQPGFERPGHDSLVVQNEIAMAVSFRTAMVLRFNGSAARQARLEIAEIRSSESSRAGMGLSALQGL